MQMVWWICHVSHRNRKSSKELKNRLGISNVTMFLRQTRLRCFSHVKKRNNENPVNNCRFTEVGSQRGNGRLCKRSNQLIKDDLRKLRLHSGLTQNWLAWRKGIRETHPTHASMDMDIK